MVTELGSVIMSQRIARKSLPATNFGAEFSALHTTSPVGFKKKFAPPAENGRNQLIEGWTGFRNLKTMDSFNFKRSCHLCHTPSLFPYGVLHPRKEHIA
jgi:hypothetical protein